MGKPTVLCWSSGKDSAWALNVMRESGEHDVVALLTTVNSSNGRVSMHGTPREILMAQAVAVGLPLIEVPVPWPCANEQYDGAMAYALSSVRDRFGAEHVAFGDLFLTDVRSYREQRCAASGWTPIFPVWGKPTDQLARKMIESTLTAWLSCVDSDRLPESFAGRRFDFDLLADLPPEVDPCAENGEFHTVVSDGPMFGAPLSLSFHGIVCYESFRYADLRLSSSAGPEPDGGPALHES